MSSDVTRILNAIERGDAGATDELLPLVYEELRLLAAQKLSHEKPGQTLQATALVHEAYLRLAATSGHGDWPLSSFFSAASISSHDGACHRCNWPLLPEQAASQRPSGEKATVQNSEPSAGRVITWR